MSGDGLIEVLEAQRRRDLIGPGSWDALVAHSSAFARLVDTTPTAVVDLGSGGGLPGLVLARRHWPAATWVLLDASQRRCTTLELSVAELGLVSRVRVVWARAEDAGRDPTHRRRADLVVARRFASPAVTAECAAPLLRPGGVLVVSEPPGSDGDRWPEGGLARLGQMLDRTEVVDGATFVRIVQREPCPEQLPRPAGRAARRPQF